MGDVVKMVHAPTVERCIAEIETGLDVHRWLELWSDRKIDEAVAIGFYHQALQDARKALCQLAKLPPEDASRPTGEQG